MKKPKKQPVRHVKTSLTGRPLTPSALKGQRRGGLYTRWPSNRALYLYLKKKFGWTQAQVGHHMGVSQQVVSDRIKSTRRPIYVELLRAAQSEAVYDAQVYLEHNSGHTFCAATRPMLPEEFCFHISSCPQCLAYTMRLAEYAPLPAHARANWKGNRGANRTTEE